MLQQKITRIVSLGLGFFRLDAFDARWLADNSVDIVRFNFSHIDYAKVDVAMHHFKTQFPRIKLLQDLQGQKWRVANSFKGEASVRKGERVLFCDHKRYEVFRKVRVDHLCIPIAMESDFSVLRDATSLSLKDGLADFRILENHAAEEGFIVAESKTAVVVRAEKSINIPGVARHMLAAMTAKDKADLVWGLARGVDIVCLSFVNKAEDIRELRRMIDQSLPQGKIKPAIWAKIETKDGYENCAAILQEVDGIMLGRGDLIPELGRFESSLAQYAVLRLCHANAPKKDCIVATHVLDSMMVEHDALPSITNLNDICQSVLAGATGFMLTSEVGHGKQPRQTIVVFNDYLSFLEKNLS